MNIDDMRSDEQYLSAAISTVIKSGKITLNTVQTLVEFAPEIMYPFANAMGVEVGRLKEMAHNEMLNEQAVSVLMDLISSKLMNKRLDDFIQIDLPNAVREMVRDELHKQTKEAASSK